MGIDMALLVALYKELNKRMVDIAASSYDV